MNPATSNAAFDHAVREYPRESCGLIVMVDGVEEYIPCTNIADDPRVNAAVSPQDYADAEDRGQIVAMVHSHPNGTATPSPGDLSACEASNMEYIILAVHGPDPGDSQSVTRVVATNSIIPKGYRAPLIGRPYSHGIHDCYTLIQDYYNWEHGIILPKFTYPEKWWEKGHDFYTQNFKDAGFAPIENLSEPGDIIFMQIRSKVVNHAGVFMGGDKFIQHPYNQLSRMDVYGGYWAHVTRMFLRKVQ